LADLGEVASAEPRVPEVYSVPEVEDKSMPSKNKIWNNPEKQERDPKPRLESELKTVQRPSTVK